MITLRPRLTVNTLLSTDLHEYGRKNFLLMFREGRELRVILSPEHHFKNSSKREKGEGEARMSESLIYADLNLTEPTRPKLQNVTDEGRFNHSALSFLHIRQPLPHILQECCGAPKPQRRQRKGEGQCCEERAGGLSACSFTKNGGLL